MTGNPREEFKAFYAKHHQLSEESAASCFVSYPDDRSQWWPDMEREFAFWLAARSYVPDGYCLMPTCLTAENGAKYLLSGEFHVEALHTCPECYALDEPDEECEICNGEGEFTVRHQVDWDTLKDIYRKAVEGLALKPGGDA